MFSLRWLLLLVITSVIWILILIFKPSFIESKRNEGSAETSGGKCNRVLITGAAGFIGYHLSKTLALHSNTNVIGLDNFNEFYDPDLKRARAFELHRLGISIRYGDVCDSELLKEIIEKKKIDCVVHLAAQPGVRYSVEDPQAYVTANVDCFVKLLDVFTEFKTLHLVFASSSSVYGPMASIPFSVQNELERPGNMYAMTKQANEKLAVLYCKTDGLSALGVRFFTVYGPWGRPDMAVYKFALKISKGEEVPLFNEEGVSLERDFTYISDIVDGIVRSLHYRPAQCGEVLNLGRGHPEKVTDLIQLLEVKLKKKSVLKLLPLPPTELLKTYADIKESTEKLGYQPTVRLEEGVHLFVDWFQKYHAERNSSQAVSGLPSPADQFMDRLTEEKKRRESKAAEAALIQRNNFLKAKLDAAKQRFTEHALKNNMPLPKLEKTKFFFFEGQESPQEDIMQLPFLKGNIKELKAHCLAVDQCVAFTSTGMLKKRVKPKHKWHSLADRKEGLYIADIDMCLADLYSCPKHASCVSRGPGQFACECQGNYWGSRCIPRLVGNRSPSELEKEEKFIDDINGVDWNAIKGHADFIFFPGLDSPGGDYLVAKHLSGRTDDLKEACRNTRRCLAFNTNGILKSSLQWSTKWMQWTDSPLHGLHILDLNYCTLDEMECPEHAHCQRYGPANYSCVCEKGFKMIQKDLKDLCIPEEEADGLVHIVLSSDSEHLKGLAAAVTSVLDNAGSPGVIRFHVVSVRESVESVKAYLTCAGITSEHMSQIEIVAFDESWLGEKIVVYSDPKVVGNLASRANFARFYFDKLFPNLGKVLYLDVDVIVQKDVIKLWADILKMKSVIAAVKRLSPTYGMFFKKPVQDLFKERYGSSFKASDPTFNAGVFAVNLIKWKNQKIADEVHFWMRQNRERLLWSFGTQPLMLLSLHSQWDELPAGWNMAGLGYNTEFKREQLDGAALLHWNGRRKPWLQDGLYKDRWHQYDKECSGHGNCRKSSEGNQWSCFVK